MKTQIFFRADGHSKIGLGHVIRSLALADCLKERFDCKFIIRNPSDSIRTLIEKSCSEIYELPEIFPFQKGGSFDTNGDVPIAIGMHLSEKTSDVFLQTDPVRCTSPKKVQSTDPVCRINIESDLPKVQRTDPVCSSKTKLQKEAELLSKTIFKGNEILVLDGYNFDSEYQKVLKPHVGKMVCIDDIHSTHFHADVIINHAAGVTKNDYSAEAETQFCLGFDYLLLRKPFLEAASAKNNSWEAPIHVSNEVVSRQQKNNFFLCLGGADPKNDTIKVLKKAMSVHTNGHFFVVIGSAYCFKEELKKLQKQHSKNITILQNLNAEKMVEVMQSCHTAITSPSTVSLEYLAIGGNLFLYQIADNQTRIFNFLTKNQLAFDFEKFGKIESIHQNVASANQKAIIDGNSQKRLEKIFRELSFELRSNLRWARGYDVMDYFELANDSGTRQGSFSKEKIPFSTHEKWFYKKLANRNVKMYLLEIDEEFAGQIRFDIAEKAVVSYSIAPQFRGMGFGKLLLKKGIEKFKNEVNAYMRIEGFVKKENKPSNRIFQNLGFRQMETEVLPNAFRYFLEAPVLA